MVGGSRRIVGERRAITLHAFVGVGEYRLRLGLRHGLKPAWSGDLVQPRNSL